VERGEAHPRSFTLRSMAQRLATAGDLWTDLSASAQSLHAPLDRLKGL